MNPSGVDVGFRFQRLYLKDLEEVGVLERLDTCCFGWRDRFVDVFYSHQRPLF